jgi:citrate synthase
VSGSEQAPADQPEWRTGIAEIRGDVPYLYGYDLTEAATLDVDFSAIMLLAFTGRMPTRNESRMANAMMVVSAAHGISPSGALARIFAASGVPIQVAVGGAALSIGDYHGGAGEQLGEALHSVEDELGPDAEPAVIARALVERFRSVGERVPGFGHPMHGGGDPRAPLFLDLSERWGVAGRYTAICREVERVLGERTSRVIGMNVNGAICAILSDLGVPPQFMRVFNIASRSPVLGAMAAEEVERERRWRMTASGDDVVYDGPAPRPVPDGWRSPEGAGS